MRTIPNSAVGKPNPLITLAALMAVTFLLQWGAPLPAAAAKPVIYDIDFEYVDDFLCGTPVLIHVTGRIIGRFGDESYTLIEPLKTDYTNLENGKSVSTRIAGPITGGYFGGFVYRGVVLIHLDHGVWVDAGNVETTLEYDPDTGEFVEIIVRAVGLHPGSIDEAICAALQ